MPIHYQKKLIFIAIPKTSTTSICYTLFPKLSSMTKEKRKYHLLIESMKINGANRVLSHLKLSEIINLKPSIDINNFNIITVVRNPFDRLFSAYCHVKKFSPKHPIFGDINLIDFNKFVKLLYDKFSDLEFLSKGQRRDYYRHFCPQVDFLKLDGKIRVDKIYRFEKYEEVIKDLNIKVKKNCTTNGLKYTDFYNEASKKLVEELYQDDLDFFGYNF